MPIITSPTPQYINPKTGKPVFNANIYIGKTSTDPLKPENRVAVYWLNESSEKIYLPQPLVTNGAGVIEYEGMPVTVWTDNAYSLVILDSRKAQIYKDFYVEDGAYFLRRDLGDPDIGYRIVAGSAPIDSPAFTGNPTAPTPAAGDNDTSIATTAFVKTALSAAVSGGVVGVSAMWNGTTIPANALLENGAMVSKTAYPDLYAVIGDQVAVANGLTPDSGYFYLPDSRSRYWRGSDSGSGRSDAVLQKWYDDTLKSHEHTFTRGGWNADSNDHDNDEGLWGNGTEKTQTTSPVGDAETRPKTIVKTPINWALGAQQIASVTAWPPADLRDTATPAWLCAPPAEFHNPAPPPRRGRVTG